MIEWNVRNLQTVFARKIQNHGKTKGFVIFFQKIMWTIEILRTKEVECQMGYCIVNAFITSLKIVEKTKMYTFLESLQIMQFQNPSFDDFTFI